MNSPVPIAQSSAHIAAAPTARASSVAAMQPALALSAIGLLGIGILGLVYGDFALVWQPVANWVPGRTALAYLTGAIECITAAGMLLPATTRWAVRVLFPGVVIWQLLKVPALFLAPGVEDSYLSFGETALIFAGGWVLFARLADLPEASPFALFTGERAVRIAQIFLGVWIIPIGVSHFVYHQATILLIPQWLPDRSFFAYLTGAGQIASGLGLVFNVLPRAAAYAEAAQLWIYTLLIWVPAVIFGPNTDVQQVFGSGGGARMPWTALLVTWLPAACALAVAQGLPGPERSRR
ncbi:MAG TPA: hypothetical protein VL967_15400 [Terracidiphilus sp.]|nr:hypothetical protein [Terracidiphilus sp.]